MPKTKRISHRFGGCHVELEEVYTTHWVQMVGEAILRCDDDAKEKGWGVWTLIGPKRSATWSGGPFGCQGFDPKNWMQQDHVETFITEADYS